MIYINNVKIRCNSNALWKCAERERYRFKEEENIGSVQRGREYNIMSEYHPTQERF